MMRLLFLVLSAFACPAAAQALERSQLSYVLEPVIVENELRLQVDFYFLGSETGGDTLLLPDSGAGQEELYKAVQDIHVVTQGAGLQRTKKPQIMTISHKPGEIVHIRYQIVQDWKGSIQDEIYYRPILNPDYFHFFGGGVFVHPDWKTDEPRRITLTWKNIPKGWTIANSFGENQTTQEFESSIGKFHQAVYVGGDFRIYGLEIKGKPLSVAMRGRWLFSDAEFTRLAEKIVRAGRDFWGDHEFPYFLITLLPTDEPCCDLGGTGLTNAFALFVSSGVNIGMGKLEYTLTHELFHAWNGIKIRRQQPDELLYWFSEGFTDYYTNLLNLRTGLITLEEYVAKYNKTLFRYFKSPMRNEANERIRKDFWNNDLVEKLPYQRGCILAHNWNAAIKRANGNVVSLDDVMRDLLSAALNQGTVVSSGSLDGIMRRYEKGGILPDVEKYVEDGETIDPAPDSLGECASLKSTETDIADLGFNYPASKKLYRVTGVRPGGNADAAGLRDGQEIVGYDVSYGDVSRQAGIKVKDGQGERWIRYYPMAGKMKIPQYALDLPRYEKDPKSCLAWFGAD